MGKKIVATVSLAGCFGCHMSLLDIDTELLDMVELVSFDKSPFTDFKKFTSRCHIGLVEGGVCNSENVETLRKFVHNAIYSYRLENAQCGVVYPPCAMLFR
jgi:coenzyme F420-reducing hydrogenase gamma subunit